MARCARKSCGRWRPGILARAVGLGLRLDGAWYCSSTCLELAARDRLARTSPVVTPAVPAIGPPRFGGVLATLKKLPREVVEQAATEQARTGLRLGTQLVAMGVVSKFDVLRALASQNGVGFLTAVDATRVTAAPGNLSPHVVRALGLVPFEADRRHDVLKVACMAPVPHSAVAALRELTGWIIEPYLVADEQWPALAEAYGSSAREDGPAYSTLPDVAAVAAHVAELARQAGDVRMAEARCMEHLWVRLDIGPRVEEFWVTLQPAPAPTDGVLSRMAGKARPRRPRASVVQDRPKRAAVERKRPVRERPALEVTPAVRESGELNDCLVPGSLQGGPTAPVAVGGGQTLDLGFLDAWE
jgi:hypothetical protein